MADPDTATTTGPAATAAAAAPAADGADDARLVRRMAAGEDAALGDLYDRYSTLLLALVRRVLDDAGEAEEVLQEVFLQAWNQAGRYDGSRSSVSTWLVLIARSRAIDRLRTRQVVDRTLASMQLENPIRHASPEGASSVLTAERRSRLQRELAELPAEQRHVLELAFYRGMTQTEIAAAVGIPLGTVKTRTLLAMKKLRHALRDDVHELL